nr:hypothetical protein [Tanacetum cinerariifolium]
MEAKRIANDDLDAFNNIPLSIIEHILCLLPIKDAVRTSILSKIWRYRWTKIPKLEFKLEDMVNDYQLEEQLFADWSSESKALMMRCKRFFAIHQVLLMHNAPILDFSFKMIEPDDTCVEIEQMIIHLARTNNNVKKLKFKITRYWDVIDYCPYEVPISIFLLRHLTDLHIENCTLGNVVPTLDGFGSLISSQCQWIIENSHVPPELPMALIHLKCLCLTSMMLLDTYGLQFLFLVIRSSPNLEKIELHIDNNDYFDFKTDKDFEIRSDALKDCSDIWLEHLKELEIIDFANLKHEMKFVKLILERAPMLKKKSLFRADVERKFEVEY